MWKTRNLAAIAILTIAILGAFVIYKTPSAAAPAKSKRRTMIAAYVGNEPPELLKFERWLGRPVDGHQVHTASNNWADWESTIPWEIDLWKNIDRPIFWSIPLIAKEGTLSDAAAGKYNDHYRNAARILAAASSKRPKIYIRTGWEFNAEWMPWNALEGRGHDYAEAYRQFVTSFRAESNKFLFEWTPNVGDRGMDPAEAYPGDRYVDVIGMDFYWHLQWDPKDPVEAWKEKVGQKYGLQWLEDFAAKHHKPTAYAEWGVMSDDAGPYVRLAAQWFANHDVVYQSYWNSNADFRGKLSDDQYKKVGAIYRAQFGPAAKR
ncbi:MAG TPA: glycosyl hydrolase [Polyangiales bacterium]|nr:glycosyl hydrolase [Polyangiales bacterium]